VLAYILNCAVQVDGKPEFVIEVEENGHETVEFRHGFSFMKSIVLPAGAKA
jgi:hypothetical protein